MPDAVSQVLTYVAFPALAIVLGAVWAAYRTPGTNLTSVIQHFAAGVVFAAVAGELLPELLDEHAPVAIAAGFTMGLATMLAIQHLTEGSGPVPTAEPKPSTGLIVTISVDIAIDGMLLGIGFVAGATQGLLLMVALTLEVLFLGLAAAIALSRGGASRVRVIGITAALAVMLAIMAVASAWLFGGLSGAWLAAIIAFGAAALLFLVTEELLVEAHEVRETPIATSFFFLGFLILMMIETLAE